MAMILNRMGYWLRPVVKAKPKNCLRPMPYFANLKATDLTNRSSGTKRLSLDCKATVKLSEFFPSGITRGENRALDHNFGEKYIPFGFVDEDSGQLYLSFRSSFKTSDLIVDELENWWKALPLGEQESLELLQLKMENRTHLIVQLNQNVYEKGETLSKTIMKAIEQRLQRNPELPKWDILIQPIIG